MSTERIAFYDHHPFDWTENFSSAELIATLTPLLATFIEGIQPQMLVVDVGCGPGRVMKCLVRRGLRSVGIDLSSASVRLMSSRSGRPGVVASCLGLPFADGTVDRTIADGVIHHTQDPFAAFAETCRVLKEGGLFYLAVYKPGGRYQKLYRFPGGLIRSLIGNPMGKTIVYFTLLPVYYLAHLIKSRGRRSWSGAKNLFYDYFVTPIAEFISYEEVQAWSGKCQVEIVEYHPNPSLNVHSFILRKTPHSAPAETPKQ